MARNLAKISDFLHQLPYLNWYFISLELLKYINDEKRTKRVMEYDEIEVATI